MRVLLKVIHHDLTVHDTFCECLKLLKSINYNNKLLTLTSFVPRLFSTYSIINIKKVVNNKKMNSTLKLTLFYV